MRKTGHLLPGDLPDVALDLFDRFLEGRSFHDVVLPSAKVRLARLDSPSQPLVQAPQPPPSLLRRKDYLPGGKAAMKTVNAWAASRAAAGDARSSGLLAVALLLLLAAAGGVALMMRRYKAARQAALSGGGGGVDTVEVMFDGAHAAHTPALFSVTAAPSQPSAASYAYGSGAAAAAASAQSAATGKPRKPWSAKALYVANAGYQPIDGSTH